jgi:transposase
MKKAVKCSPEVMERAVRLVFEASAQYESQWATSGSIAAKMGCTAETPRRWVRRHERDTDRREGLSTTEQDRIPTLEREVREPRKADEIPRSASAFFAQAELDRRFN